MCACDSHRVVAWVCLASSFSATTVMSAWRLFALCRLPYCVTVATANWQLWHCGTVVPVGCRYEQFGTEAAEIEAAADVLADLAYSY